jgi:hypothetical protein
MKTKLVVGDVVKMGSKNPNHLGYGVSAYSGMKGVVNEVWEDGSFCIKTDTSVLVVPMNKGGVWIHLNDSEQFYYKKISNNRNFLKNIFKK